MNALERICALKREHISARKQIIAQGDLEKIATGAEPPRSFVKALKAKATDGQTALIAEIKKASPSAGVIRADYNPAILAGQYEQAGAACLSVLTDTPAFQGRDEDLSAARSACALPVLRKDFILDLYQVVESRALGADCVLIIMAALPDSYAREISAAAWHYGMDVLVEVHDERELERALTLNANMIGINSRNLATLEVDLGTAHALAKKMPSDVLKVAESGIRTHQDLTELKTSGFDAFLIGESFMRQADLAEAVRKLILGY